MPVKLFANLLGKEIKSPEKIELVRIPRAKSLRSGGLKQPMDVLGRVHFIAITEVTGILKKAWQAGQVE